MHVYALTQAPSVTQVIFDLKIIIWIFMNNVACTVNHRPAYRLSPTHLLAQDFQLLVGAGGHWNGDHGDPGCRGCWGTPWTPWSRRRTGSSQASQPARRSPSWAPERRATRATRATLAVATGWLVAPWADLRRFASQYNFLGPKLQHCATLENSCNMSRLLLHKATFSISDPVPLKKSEPKDIQSFKSSQNSCWAAWAAAAEISELLSPQDVLT